MACQRKPTRGSIIHGCVVSLTKVQVSQSVTWIGGAKATTHLQRRSEHEPAKKKAVRHRLSQGRPAVPRCQPADDEFSAKGAWLISAVGRGPAGPETVPKTRSLDQRKPTWTNRCLRWTRCWPDQSESWPIRRASGGTLTAKLASPSNGSSSSKACALRRRLVWNHRNFPSVQPLTRVGTREWEDGDPVGI